MESTNLHNSSYINNRDLHGLNWRGIPKEKFITHSQVTSHACTNASSHDVHQDLRSSTKNERNDEKKKKCCSWQVSWSQYEGTDYAYSCRWLQWWPWRQGNSKRSSRQLRNEVADGQPEGEVAGSLTGTAGGFKNDIGGDPCNHRNLPLIQYLLQKLPPLPSYPRSMR